MRQGRGLTSVSAVCFPVEDLAREFRCCPLHPQKLLTNACPCVPCRHESFIAQAAVAPRHIRALAPIADVRGLCTLIHVWRSGGGEKGRLGCSPAGMEGEPKDPAAGSVACPRSGWLHLGRLGWIPPSTHLRTSSRRASRSSHVRSHSGSCPPCWCSAPHSHRSRRDIRLCLREAGQRWRGGAMGRSQAWGWRATPTPPRPPVCVWQVGVVSPEQPWPSGVLWKPTWQEHWKAPMTLTQWPWGHRPSLREHSSTSGGRARGSWGQV